ncbi:hypothetical protein B0H14DRAFT_2336268, partial [Mycena olivaceomarginata]
LKIFVFLFVISSQALSAIGFANPVKSPNGPDPFMVRCSTLLVLVLTVCFHEGFYFFTTTTWTNIQITRATTIAGLKTATPKVIWSDSTVSRCCNVWAPGKSMF